MRRSWLPTVASLALWAWAGCSNHDRRRMVTPDLAARCAACATYGAATRAGQIVDPADRATLPVSELSGIAASRRYPGVYYVHNDDGAVVYAINAAGRMLAIYALQSAAADNLEDIAVGPCGATSCIFAGNIGDNNAGSSTRQIHRFVEPVLDAGEDEMTVPVAVQTITFSYEDGPHNAEALLVHPQSGDLYIVTKASTAGVYRLLAAEATTAGVRTFTSVGTLDLDRVTGGDIHPCGDRVILRTLSSIVELEQPPGAAFDAIWTATPTPVPKPADEGQGEAVGYDRDGLGYVLTYEGNAPVPLNQVRCE